MAEQISSEGELSGKEGRRSVSNQGGGAACAYARIRRRRRPNRGRRMEGGRCKRRQRSLKIRRVWPIDDNAFLASHGSTGCGLPLKSSVGDEVRIGCISCQEMNVTPI
jgi:hypothetical protein